MKPLQTLQAARAFVRIARNPSRLDEVFNLSDGVVDPETMRAMAEHVRDDAGGASALVERPHVHLDLATLRALPEGTLGRVYAELMIGNGLDPKDIPTLPARDEHEYIRAHLYETHDLWHAATGFATDVAGELGLQAFYAAQLPGRLPWAILAAGFLNTLLFAYDDRDRRLGAIARGWQLGRRSRPLFGARWDELYALPLAEVRARLGLDVDGVDAGVPARDRAALRAAA